MSDLTVTPLTRNHQDAVIDVFFRARRPGDVPRRSPTQDIKIAHLVDDPADQQRAAPEDCEVAERKIECPKIIEDLPTMALIDLPFHPISIARNRPA